MPHDRTKNIFGEMCIPDISDLSLSANFIALDWNRATWDISMFGTSPEIARELPAVTIGKMDEKQCPSESEPMFGTHIREAIDVLKGRGIR